MVKTQRHVDSWASPFAWAMLESLPHAVIAVGTHGEVRCFNLAAKRLVGCDPQETHDCALNDVLHLLDARTRMPIASPVDHLLASPGTRAGSYDVLVRRNGSEVPIEHSANLIHDDTGAIVGTLFVLRDASRTRDLMHRLNVRATHDGLTRLLNRTEFERRLARALANMIDGDTHALFYIDLDGFKNVNDTYGHGAGDAVLRDVARVLRTRSRRQDTLARLGGDEFGILLEHCPPKTAAEFAQGLSIALEVHPFRVRDKTVRLGASIGLTSIVGPQRSVRELLGDADRACYAIKRTRRPMRFPVAPVGLLGRSVLHS